MKVNSLAKYSRNRIQYHASHCKISSVCYDEKIRFNNVVSVSEIANFALLHPMPDSINLVSQMTKSLN